MVGSRINIEVYLETNLRNTSIYLYVMLYKLTMLKHKIAPYRFFFPKLLRLTRNNYVKNLWQYVNFFFFIRKLISC